MVQAASASKNIWVAASDGDLERVRTLIETQNLSPNVKDSNSYTPMHAAASYAHLDILEYLISVGGDINLRDDDGDTPLFVVESVDVARWMVERGADPALRNEEGLTAAEALQDDNPEVASYLFSLSVSPLTAPNDTAQPQAQVSELAVDNYTSQQTSTLLQETQRIMEDAERNGSDPDAALREVVGRAVREGFSFGGSLGDADDAGAEEEEVKRARADGEAR